MPVIILRMTRKVRYYPLFFLLVITVVLLYKNYQKTTFLKSTAYQELLHFKLSADEQCKNITIPEFTMTFSSQPSLGNFFAQPSCSNINHNMTKGRWKRNKKQNEMLEKDIKQTYETYWRKVGIPLQQWRHDGRCGHNVVCPKLSNDWPQVASFCDPKSSKPCCSNFKAGKCIAITDEFQCNCPGCINTRKYKDASLSTWVVEDERCRWKNYTDLGACSVLNRLSTKNNPASFHFVGDSLLRNTYMGLVLIITGEPKFGLWKTCVTTELQRFCYGENMFVQRPCHDLVAAYSLDDIRHNNSTLCGGKRQFRAFYHNIAVPTQHRDFNNLIQNLKGKINTYVIAGVGLHFNLDHEEIIQTYLNPALATLKHSKTNWPKILWIHPLSIGLLKPPTYIRTQGDDAIEHFVQAMNEYLKKQKIPWFDFRQITKEVHSYDGTHYGMGVNMMKAQVFLNYAATIT